VAGALRAWDRHDLLDDALVVISELASNAVVHARSDFVVTVTLDGGLVRLVVADVSSVAPTAAHAASTSTSGRGLALVAALTVRWGHDVHGAGKDVWAELAG
jgi:anti-sigma regulatory factor (Ser/Thr protein kinase)